ncbi:MAG: hypothetical protein IH804_04025, partial [Planctomycetes bacterium]|nr:hypothetical protein [Planctomycetota bacterium]
MTVLREGPHRNPHGEIEGPWVGEAGIEQLMKEGESAKSIAVLTRYNRMAHDIAEQLAHRSIATRVLGGSERFYTRLEVRDIANALDS